MNDDNNEDIKQLSVEEARTLMQAGEVIVIDIRATPDHENESIPGARHLTPDNFEEFLTTTEKDKPVICYCYFGNSSLGVCAALQDHGFTMAFSLAGGFDAWKNAPA
ncbi:MAG: thiosulfate sulfurtransferase GlpE [Candidatus Omnitrophica bacterium]|nr:thiosulfate sulfurtransferase GlpE [Candidatus Omnitrophota bacterium]